MGQKIKSGPGGFPVLAQSHRFLDAGTADLVRVVLAAYEF